MRKIVRFPLILCENLKSTQHNLQFQGSKKVLIEIVKSMHLFVFIKYPVNLSSKSRR